MKKNANKGFSLVELIIVIAIMAVLVGVLAPQFIKQVEKSRISTDMQNIEEIKIAVQTYAADKGFTSGSQAFATGSGGTTITDAFIKAAVEDAGLPTKIVLKSSKWTNVKIVVDDKGVCAYGTATYNGTNYTMSDGAGSTGGSTTGG